MILEQQLGAMLNFHYAGICVCISARLLFTAQLLLVRPRGVDPLRQAAQGRPSRQRPPAAFRCRRGNVSLRKDVYQLGNVA